MNYFIFLCLTSILFFQEDTITFTINIEQYNKLANKKFIHLLEIEDINYCDPSVVVLDKVWLIAEKKNNKSSDYSELSKYTVLSIPYFWLNDSAKKYKSGDNLECIINFINEPSFQEVLILRKDIQVGSFYITYSNVEILRMRDSTKNQNLLISNPFIGRSDYVERHIFEYILQNPDIFVFKLKDLAGYWAIKDGHLIRLVENCILGFCKISEENANVYFANTFSDELIRDLAANYSMRSGYHYLLSEKEFAEEDFKKIRIDLNLTGNNISD